MSDASSKSLVPYSDVVESLKEKTPDLTEDQIKQICKEQMILPKRANNPGFRGRIYGPDSAEEYSKKYVTQEEADRLRRAVSESRESPQSD